LLLQRCIRHEIPQQEAWRFPPGGLDLNDQIAAALLLCSRYHLAEAALQLSWGDLLALDYTVPADAKDVNGNAIGRGILLKSYAGRADLRRGFPIPEVAGNAEPDKLTVQQRLAASSWQAPQEERWQDDA